MRASNAFEDYKCKKYLFIAGKRDKNFGFYLQ